MTASARKPAPTMAHVSISVDPPWIVQALKKKGVHEGTDARPNPIVLQMFADATGNHSVKNNHRTPWCGAFVGSSFKRCGIAVPENPLWALNWASWGQKLAQPLYGCVAIKERNGGGHVTFVVGRAGTSLLCLGGNQGDAVTIEAIPRAAFCAFRWPPGLKIPAAAPLPTHVAAAGANLSEA